MLSHFGLKVTVILMAVFSTVLAVSPALADSTITDQEDCETNLLGSWSDLGDGSGECHH